MHYKSIKLVNRFLVFQNEIPLKPCNWDVPFPFLVFQSLFSGLPVHFLFPLQDSLDYLWQFLPVLLVHAISNKQSTNILSVIGEPCLRWGFLAYQQHFYELLWWNNNRIGRPRRKYGGWNIWIPDIPQNCAYFLPWAAYYSHEASSFPWPTNDFHKATHYWIDQNNIIWKHFY